MGTQGKGKKYCRYLRDFYATRRVYGKMIENVQYANNGEPSQTMVTINKAVLFYDFSREEI